MDKNEIVKCLNTIQEALLEIDLSGKIYKDTRQQLGKDIIPVKMFKKKRIKNVEKNIGFFILLSLGILFLIGSATFYFHQERMISVTLLIVGISLLLVSEDVKKEYESKSILSKNKFKGLVLLIGIFLISGCTIATDNRPTYLDPPTTDNPQLIDLTPPIKEEIYPICGNGKCERFNGIDELTSCSKDCSFDTPIQKPACGNGLCEVYGGVDEFYSCGYGTANDCNVKCTSQECWIDYCPQGCGQNPSIIDTPSQNFKIKVYYVYNSGEKDEGVINNIIPTIKKTSQLFKSYNGITLTPTLETIQISYDIGNGHDVYYPFSERQQIWRAVSNTVDLRQDVTNFDGVWLILAGTVGGAFSIDYMSPIYFDGDHFESDGDGILTAHEFLHSFGCKDINGGKKGCIMGDLSINTISDSTLCECKNLFIPQNYGKQPYSEYVGSGFIQQSIMGINGEKVYTSPFED